MALGIENAEKFVGNLVTVINAGEEVRSADFGLILKEMLDADEEELKKLVEKIKALNISNDVLEAKIKELAAQGAPMAAFVLRMVKIFFPKQP